MIAGFVSEKSLKKWKNIPRYLSEFQFYERHKAVIRTEFPERILPFIAAFDINQDAVIRVLMSIRKLPQKLQRRRAGSQPDSFGMDNFTLLEQSPTELCYGLKGQFWRADFGLESAPDAAAYLAPPEDGNAKLLLRYQVSRVYENRYELCTETFIYCPDRLTQLKMSAYWLAIRAGSGLIRKRTLRAVKRNLEENIPAGREA